MNCQDLPPPYFVLRTYADCTLPFGPAGDWFCTGHLSTEVTMYLSFALAVCRNVTCLLYPLMLFSSSFFLFVERNAMYSII